MAPLFVSLVTVPLFDTPRPPTPPFNEVPPPAPPAIVPPALLIKASMLTPAPTRTDVPPDVPTVVPEAPGPPLIAPVLASSRHRAGGRINACRPAEDAPATRDGDLAARAGNGPGSRGADDLVRARAVGPRGPRRGERRKDDQRSAGQQRYASVRNTSPRRRIGVTIVGENRVHRATSTFNLSGARIRGSKTSLSAQAVYCMCDYSHERTKGATIE